MVFSSPLFLFGFLPFTLACYFALVRAFPASTRNGWANFLLLTLSLCFYATSEQKFLPLLLATAALDYACARFIEHRGTDGPRRSRAQKAALTLSIGTNLAVLGYFKYSFFAVTKANDLFSALGWPALNTGPFEGIVLPLGISFYTFQTMSYTIDVYRGEVKSSRSFVDFACLVTLFLHLIAGPIVRYSDLAAQLLRRSLTREAFARGVSRFILGLGKKLLIADILAGPAEQIFLLPSDQLSTGIAWLGAGAFALQIYFDFSGYSDMAIGMADMLGFSFPENFNYPYISQSMREFWRRWHITLSTWFRDYLYIPLGGNQGSPARTHFNLMAVFLLCGLWHGAALQFLLWGVYHGFFLVLERTRFGAWLDGLPRPLRHAYALTATLFGWAVFNARSLSHALSFMAAMLGLASVDFEFARFAGYWGADIPLAFAAGIIGSIPWLPAFRRWRGKLEASEKSPALARFLYPAALAGLAAVFFFSGMRAAAETYHPFLYFRF